MTTHLSSNSINAGTSRATRSPHFLSATKYKPTKPILREASRWSSSFCFFSYLNLNLKRRCTPSQPERLPHSITGQSSNTNVFVLVQKPYPSNSIRLPKNSRSCGGNRFPCVPTTEPNDFFTGRSTLQYLYESITAPGNIG